MDRLKQTKFLKNAKYVFHEIHYQNKTAVENQFAQFALKIAQVIFRNVFIVNNILCDCMLITGIKASILKINLKVKESKRKNNFDCLRIR